MLLFIFIIGFQYVCLATYSPSFVCSGYTVILVFVGYFFFFLFASAFNSYSSGALDASNLTNLSTILIIPYFKNSHKNL